MNWSALRDALYDWTVIGGDTAIWLNQSAPQPTEDYYGLQIVSVIRVGDDYVASTANGDGEIEVLGNRDFTLNIHYYGVDAFLKIDDKVNSLQLPTVQNYLNENNIIYVNNGNTTDAPNLYDSSYKEHALNTITFRAANIQIDNTGYYDNVIIDGSIKEGTNTITRTIDVQI